jgi:hypothetical protein
MIQGGMKLFNPNHYNLFICKPLYNTNQCTRYFFIIVRTVRVQYSGNLQPDQTAYLSAMIPTPAQRQWSGLYYGGPMFIVQNELKFFFKFKKKKSSTVVCIKTYPKHKPRE